MGNHRLRRLAQLTQGAALIGLGLSTSACEKDPQVNAPYKEKPHINAPPDPQPSASVASSASAPEPVDPPHVNSPAPKEPKPAPSVSPSASGKLPQPALPKHTNSPAPKG